MTPTHSDISNAAAPAEIRRQFSLSKKEGLAFSLMVGLGETYLPAFVLGSGMGEVASGLVATIPVLIGAFFQTQTPLLVNRLRSYKNWILLCVALQAATLAALSWMALVHTSNTLVVFLAASIYWACAMSAGPTWNAWMGWLVPASDRTSFWSQRTRITQIGTLIGFVLGGLLLQRLARVSSINPFFPIFLLAFVGRLFSLTLLWRQYEPKHLPDKKLVEEATFHPIGWVRKHSNYTFIKYVLFIHFSTFIASPFFTPFMLEHLQLNYFEYTLLTATALAAKFISLPYISKIIVNRSTQTVIRLAGIGVATLPALWLLSDWFPYLIFIQLVGGVFWGALDLAFPLLIIESTPDNARLPTLTSYNLLRSCVLVGGSALGGGILHFLGKEYLAYAIIFALSSGLRALSIGTLWTLPISRIRITAFWRVVGIETVRGAILTPVLSSIQKIQSKKTKKEDTHERSVG